MPATTSNRKIPYPIPGDKVADYPATAQNAATILDTALSDTGWLDLVSKTGTSTGLRARRIGDVLYLTGALYGPNNVAIANGASVACGVLPASCRPTATRYIVVSSWVSGGNPAYGRTLTLRIYTDGTLTLDNASGNASSCADIDVALAR